MIDTFADFLLHPGATTAAATTETLVAMTLHLGDAVAVEDVEDVARLIVDVVIASDVAGVVIRELALIKVFRKIDLLVDPEFVDEDRVMKYLVVAAKLRVFVLNGIEAVRTGSDDGAVFRNHRGRPVTLRMVPIAMVGGCIETVAIEHLDILLGHHLPEVFVADTTGGITGAGLFRPENSEVDPGCLKHFSDRSCHELITLIKGPHTANPIEHIGVRVF